MRAGGGVGVSRWARHSCLHLSSTAYGRPCAVLQKAAYRASMPADISHGTDAESAGDAGKGLEAVRECRVRRIPATPLFDLCRHRDLQAVALTVPAPLAGAA